MQFEFEDRILTMMEGFMVAGPWICEACKPAACQRTLWVFRDAALRSFAMIWQKALALRWVSAIRCMEFRKCFLNMRVSVCACETDSSFVPPLIYAVLGSSRDIAIGPVAVVSLLLGTLLRQEVSPTKEPALYLQLAFTATFFAGLFQAALGFLRWAHSLITNLLLQILQ